MTAQIGENLHYEGQDLTMCEEPLGQFFSLLNHWPKFQDNCTALWRGYVGSWEIIDKRLYLNNINGTLDDGLEVTLDVIFPGFTERVFAHWYTGTLRIPQGQLLHYEHMGYASEYEWDLMIDIEKGVIIRKKVKENGVAEEKMSTEGYGVGAFTVFENDNNSGDK